MFKSKKSRKSDALSALALARRELADDLADKLETIGYELESMSLKDPDGKITEEELMAIKSGALAALGMARSALGATGPCSAAEFGARSARRLATDIVHEAMKAHLVTIEYQE